MAYVDHVRKSQANVEKILLLCKKPLVPFYTRCGFTYVDEADLKFGRLWLVFYILSIKLCSALTCINAVYFTFVYHYGCSFQLLKHFLQVNQE